MLDMEFSSRVAEEAGDAVILLPALMPDETEPEDVPLSLMACETVGFDDSLALEDVRLLLKALKVTELDDSSVELDVVGPAAEPIIEVALELGGLEGPL